MLSSLAMNATEYIVAYFGVEIWPPKSTFNLVVSFIES